MIKSIETYYKGYLCRSRTEARWLVAFDRIGIKYEYEPEGFDLGKAGKYLPDFYLPQFNSYAEVKGRTFNLEEIEKAKALSIQSKKSVLFLEGQPSRKGYWCIHPFVKTISEYGTINSSELPHSLHSYFTNIKKGRTRIEWLSKYKAKGCGVWHSADEDCFLLLIDVFNPDEKLSLIKNTEVYDEKEYLFPTSLPIKGIDESDSIAVRKSRSARFEHYKK
nr:hypothetical protein [uncultured Mediterranean phage uvMED]